MQTPNTLVAVPVYNEAATAERVLRRLASLGESLGFGLLVIDDGSSDDTPGIVSGLRRELGFDLIARENNMGYGRAMRDAFQRAHQRGFEWVITIDCDEQHEPERLPAFLAEIARDRVDIVSGTRYREPVDVSDPLASPPADRRAINQKITAEINERLRLDLTDAFCGYKAYRVSAVAALDLDEDGYAFPLQFWVRAVASRLRVGELPVRLIYNDPNRTFGGGLDEATRRLAHYREVLHTELCRCRERLPVNARRQLVVDCQAVA
ncbi:MAG: glycosyltransferase family 2 protein [Planctomycetota bacterium]